MYFLHQTLHLIFSCSCRFLLQIDNNNLIKQRVQWSGENKYKEERGSTRRQQNFIESASGLTRAGVGGFGPAAFPITGLGGQIFKVLGGTRGGRARNGAAAFVEQRASLVGTAGRKCGGDQCLAGAIQNFFKTKIPAIKTGTTRRDNAAHLCNFRPADLYFPGHASTKL
jgi:hypothetical protein